MIVAFRRALFDRIAITGGDRLVYPTGLPLFFYLKRLVRTWQNQNFFFFIYLYIYIITITINLVFKLRSFPVDDHGKTFRHTIVEFIQQLRMMRHTIPSSFNNFPQCFSISTFDMI